MKGKHFLKLCEVALEVATSKGFSVAEISHGTLFALIASEAGEALEAHRSGRVAKLDDLIGMTAMEPHFDPNFFKERIKDTVGDELADVVIRFAHYFGSLMDKDKHLTYNPYGVRSKNQEELLAKFDFGDAIIRLNRCILNLHDYFSGMIEYSMRGNSLICEFLGTVSVICIAEEIPLEDHIEWKIAYNKTRPHKHGKKY